MWPPAWGHLSSNLVLGLSFPGKGLFPAFLSMGEVKRQDQA